MKHIIRTSLLVFSIVSSLFAISGTVTLYYNNGTVTYNDTQTFYEFDVQVYIDGGSGTNIFDDGMIYVEYNTNVFGSYVDANNKIVSVSLEGPFAVDDEALYEIINITDTYLNTFAVTFTASKLYTDTGYDSDTYISTNSSSLTTILKIKMEVSASGTSNLDWPESITAANSLFNEHDASNSEYEALSVDNALESTSITYSSDGDPALPVTLSQLSAQYVDNKVAVSWVTESETENLGYVLKRAIKYSDDEISEYSVVSSYLYNDDLIGAGTSAEQHVYSYYDSDVKPGVNYSYILMDVDYNGNTEEHGPVSIIIPENLLYVSDDYNLGVNYPNPFNPSFTIPFELMTGMNVDIAMYDITGKKVMAIANGYFEPRQYQLHVNASELNSGIYFVRTMVGDQVHTQKMTLLK